MRKIFSQISAVRTGVRAYMDATPLHSNKQLDTGSYISLQLNTAVKIIFVFFNLSGDLRANDYICFNLH